MSTGLYALVPRLKTPNINSGDTIEVELFITGYGDEVTDNKLHIGYSAPIFQKDADGKIGIVESCIAAIEDKSGKTVGVITGDRSHVDSAGKTVPAIQQHRIDPFGAVITLNKANFMRYSEVLKMMGKSEESPMLLSEMVHSGHAPILLKFNTSSDAKAGDYDIFLTLFYKVNSIMNVDQKAIKIHVDSWIEKHQRKLQWIAVILGSSALVAGILQAIYTILQFLK